MRPTFNPRRFKAIEHSRVVIKKDSTKGSLVFIPEIKLHIKVKSKKDLKKWLINYCELHPEKLKLITKNYKL